jgi:serine/threonine protein kinase
MAPEQALEKPCLPAADWYAVGTMIYEVLTGRCPFDGALLEVLLKKQAEDPPAPFDISPFADRRLSELCMKLCIAIQPSAQPARKFSRTWVLCPANARWPRPAAFPRSAPT